ncbi:MAG: hypothetical protein P4L46_15165 [Fimbriimonas sp.]|nr:hypothetical protein [Fimbriimonas sp.]
MTSHDHDPIHEAFLAGVECLRADRTVDHLVLLLEYRDGCSSSPWSPKHTHHQLAEDAGLEIREQVKQHRRGYEYRLILGRK